ncbi:unnamed protein product [Parnassius mnemosyne]|uniref:Insulin-like domain-containing protein n=1 Tax=Parnassius mnemosyne TaxID=213953 RepID=A0AAV1KS85_9NEOP
MKIQVLLLLTIIGTISIESGNSQRIVLCGRRLAETLAMVCDSGTMMKKSVSNSIQEYKYGWQWLAPRVAHSFGQPRGKRGIVSECCEKSCSLEELLTYC